LIAAVPKRIMPLPLSADTGASGPPGVRSRPSALKGRWVMDENKDRVEEEFESGSMFSSNKIMIGMIVIALLAVLIGMGT
jgi:hypothetical protein